MANLTKASQELFRRTPDETFQSMDELFLHCQAQKEKAKDLWLPPRALEAVPEGEGMRLKAGSDGAFRMNDWSFTQLCGLARVSKDTVNRLTPETVSRVFRETLPQGNKPVQIMTAGEGVRSVHGVSYTRLFNAEVLSMLKEFATDFRPPQEGCGGATGLYAGEQDMFCFLIDPTGWAEIEGEAFAPGFFVWNSEVGKRSVGVSTFWFQAVCQNHIVWDAVEVVEVTRKHTGKVGEALSDIRNVVHELVKKRDERKDGFVRVIKKAMETKLGDNADEVIEVLVKEGITKSLGKRALELAKDQGRFTIFSVVDALTRLAGEIVNAGERSEADQKAASLLKLVAV